jgi:hypothetical protein
MLTLIGSHVNYLNVTVHSFHAEPCYLNHCHLADTIAFVTTITLAKVTVEANVAMSVLPELFPTMPTIWFQ